jgi:hypothetical protein
VVFNSQLFLFLKDFRFIEEKTIIGVISETQPANLNDLWSRFWFLPIISLYGLVILMKKINSKTLYFLGLLVPLVLLMVRERRFMFFASIPILVLTAIPIEKYFSKKKTSRIIFWASFGIIVYTLTLLVSFKSILYSIPIAWAILFFALKRSRREINIAFFMIVLAVFSYSLIVVSYRSYAPQTVIDALEHLKQEDKGSCVITNWDIGSLVNYIPEMHSYTSSVGQHQARMKKVVKFLLSQKKPRFNIDKGFVLVDMEFLGYLTSELYNFTEGYYEFSIPQGVGFDKDSQGNVNLNPKIESRGYDFSDVKKIYIDGGIVRNSKGSGCLIVFDRSRVVYMNDKLCDSNLGKMLMMEPIDDMELVYNNQFARVYSFSG